MLFSPESHEPLAGAPWSEERALAAVRTIAAAAEDAFADGWAIHPLDREDEPEGARLRTVYLGGAGVVEALRRLAARGLVELRRDCVPYLEASLAAAPDFPGEPHHERSLLMGELGIRLVLERLAPAAPGAAGNRARLARLIAANAEDERCELMWGSPGSILAGRELGVDVEPSLARLRARRDADGLWTQQLYGSAHRYTGPVHGWAGCALALDLPGDDVSAVLERLAVREGGLANWPSVEGRRLGQEGDGRIRTQWCHGAPGIVATLGDRLAEELALAGGELTWVAGPLAKGPGLCHGTAGNGYALLALHARTGDERWLGRARAFAMHAAAQVERARALHGTGRHTLWTGDLGVALYLADCVAGAGTLPLP